jgi:hypothetical protein
VHSNYLSCWCTSCLVCSLGRLKLNFEINLCGDLHLSSLFVKIELVRFGT